MPAKHTPASLIRANAKTAHFVDLPLGSTFELNGCVWVKRSSRTGAGVWPSYLPSYSYFKRGTVVNLETSN